MNCYAAMKTTFLPVLLPLVHGLLLVSNAADSSTVEGLIIPRDDGGMYIRNPEGQFEIEWTEDTQVAL
jgi:hypothetical protein